MTRHNEASAMDPRRTSSPRKVVIVAPPYVTLQDLTGPYEVFSRAAQHAPGSYLVQTAACGRSPRVITKFGLEIRCDLRLPQVGLPGDTVLIAGSDAATSGVPDPYLLDWPRRAAEFSRRTVSVCTGAFHLAQAGLLDGRRATTHWKYIELFRQRHPQVLLETDPIYTQDEQFYTSAGITTGIDLSLALVEEDCGLEIAQAVARELVVYLQRPADQSQMSAALALRMADRDPIRHLQRWVPDNLEHVRTVDDLAQQAHMSLRNFSRLFRRETGSTPAVWLRNLRLEGARRHLQQSREAARQVAHCAGYGSTRTMNRSLKQSSGTSPRQYRQQASQRATQETP